MIAPVDQAGTIRTRGLVKEFGATTALAGIDLDVFGGESLAVFGANGAGKTTLLRLLTSSLKATRGTLHISGFDPLAAGAQIRACIGVISHHLFLYDTLSARENLELFAGLYGVLAPRRRSAELLETLGLSHRADDPVQTLSRGMQQRVALGRALVHDPSIVLLDEPFTALDPNAAHLLHEILTDLEQRGRTVVLSTHDLRRGLESAGRFIVLSRGRIVLQGLSAAVDVAHLETVLREPGGPAVAR